MYVDDIKLAGKKQNIDPMCKLLNREVDLGEPTSFVDHVYLGCTQRQCEISKDIVDNYRTMFDSRISALGVEKLPFTKLHHKLLLQGNAYSYTVKRDYSCLCMWMTYNIVSMCKVLNEEVDLGEPTSLLDHVYLGCTHRQCEISKDIVDNYRTMFESRISAG